LRLIRILFNSQKVELLLCTIKVSISGTISS
jgi:hypothetical protein